MYKKNINDKLTALLEEIDDMKKAQLKVNEQLNSLELIFRENTTIFNELNDVWKDGEMKKLIVDIEENIMNNQNQLLNELSSQEDNILRKKCNLEKEYDSLYWQLKNGMGGL